MAFDAVKELEALLNARRDQGGTITVANQEDAIRALERKIRNDECEEIMSGFRAYGRTTLHEYLDKRIAKRK